METKGTRLRTNFLNPYDEVQFNFGGTDFYDDKLWSDMYKGTTQDINQYISFLQRQDKLDINYMDELYRFKDLSSNGKMLAMAAELDADNVEKKNYSIVVGYDENGKEIKETRNLTEKEYYQTLLKYEKDAIVENERLQAAQEYKDNMSTFGKIVNTIGGVAGEFVLGGADQVFSILNFVDALAEGFGEVLEWDWSAAVSDFRGAMADNRIGQMDMGWYDNISNSLREWEGQATYLARVTGERTYLGRTLGSAAYSMGQALTSSFLTAGVAGAVGGIAKGSKAYSALYRTMFYTGSSSSALQERFRDPAFNSTSTMAIIGETALKTAGQIGVEMGLEKILGAGFLDELTRGVKASGSSTYPVLSFIGNMAKEGAEEGIQEFSDWFIDAFIAYGDKENPFYSEWSWQNVGDAIMAGMLSSGLSGIVTTSVNTYKKNKLATELGIKDSKEYQALTDKKSKRKYVTGVLDMMRNYQQLVKDADFDTYTKEGMDEKFQASKEMYNAFNIIMNMYGAIGQERATKAEALLKELETAYNEKQNYYAIEQSKQFAKTLSENWKYVATVGKINSDTTKRIKDKLDNLKKDDLKTRINAAFENGEFVGDKKSTNKLNDNAKSVANKLSKDGIDVLATDAKRIVGNEDTILASTDNLNNMSSEELLKAATEDDFANTLVSEIDAVLLEEIRTVYNQIYKEGKNDNDLLMMYKLLYDGSTFNIMLMHSSRRMFSFMTNLYKLAEDVSKRDLKKEFNKQYLLTVKRLKKNLGTEVILYCCQHTDAPYADLEFLTAEQKAYIERNRYNGYVRDRVANNTMTEQDVNLLHSRINSAPFFTEDEKQSVRDDLNSNSKPIRLRGLRKLDEVYNYTFFGVFNDEIYPAGTDVKNCILTDFLMTNGIDLRYIKKGFTNDEIRKNTEAMLGGYDEIRKITYLQRLFNNFTNGDYALKISRVGNKIVDVYVVEQTNVTYDYTTGAEIARERGDFVPVPSDNKIASKLLNEHLNKNLSTTERTYVTIDDVIKYPNKYLSNKTIETIKNDYGSVNKNTAFTYFRELLSNENSTIIETLDGNYVIATYEYIDNFVKDKLSINKIVYDKEYTAKDFYKVENLPKELQDIKLIFQKGLDNPKYTHEEKIIRLPKPQATNSFKITLMHEMYHAMSVIFNFSQGFTSSIPVTQNVITDIKAHVPSLFENVPKNQWSKVVQNYIYANVSGELSAYGAYDVAIDIIPIVFDNRTNTLRMPWGSKYYVGKNIDTKSDGQNVSVKQEASIKQQNEYTKQEYDEAVDYIKKINNATQLVKTSKNPEKSMEKVDLPAETKQKILDNTYYKSKDATYTRYLTVKRSYENRLKAVERKKELAKQRKEEAKRKKAAGETYGKRYAISKKMAGDSNLKYFTNTIYPQRHERNFINFVEETTDNLDKLPEEIADRILNGTLNQDTIYEYVRKATNINDYTFKLIKKHFFPDSPFETYADLTKFLTSDLAYLYAIKGVLEEHGYDDLIMHKFNYKDTVTYKDTDGTIKKRLRIVEHFLNIPELAKDINKIVEKFGTGWYYEDGWKKGQIPVDYGNGQLVALKYFDGTIFGGNKVANKIQYAAKMGYASQYAGKKKPLSFNKQLENAKGEEGDTLEDLIGEEETQTDDISLSVKRERLVNRFVVVLEEFRKIVTETGKLSLDDAFNLMNLLTQKYKSMSKQEQAKYASKVISGIYDTKTKQFIGQGYKKLVGKYRQFIEDRSEDEISRLYAIHNIAQDYEVDEVTIDILTENSKLKERSIKIAKDTYRNLFYRNMQYVNTKNYKYLPEEYKKFFVLEKNKVKYNPDVIKNKSPEEVDALRESAKLAFRLIRKGYFENAQSVKLWKEVEKERTARLKAEQKAVKTKISAKGKVSYVTEIKSKTFEIQSEQEIPDKLKKMLDTTFDKERKSTTKFMAEENETHMVISSKQFFKDNAELLNNLTVDEVREIVNYYSSALVLPGNVSDVDLIRFDTFKTMLYAWFINRYNEGTLYIEDELVSKMKSQLEFSKRRAGTDLSTWRNVLYLVKPTEIIAQQLFHELGVEIDDAEFDPLTAAVVSGNVDKIKAEQEKLYKKILETYKGNPKNLRKAFDKMRAIQRASQLSGPATIVRAHTSNIALKGINKLADWIGAKLAKGSKKAYTLPNQYNLTGVKVTDDVKTWIDDELINNGYLDLITDGLSKFDIRDLDNVNVSTNSVVKLIIANISSTIKTENVLDNKYLSKWTKFVSKLQSDAPYINKQFISYLGRIIVSTGLDYKQGIKSPEVLDAIVSAYNMAAYDYVHRKNWVSDVENKFAQKAPKAYMAYKLVMPYLPSTYNWFVEMLDLTPFALIKNIRDLCQLEKKIATMEDLQRKGEYVPYDPRFVEMITRRKVGKGIIGTVLMAIGLGLGALGVIGVDDDDEKLKLFVPGTDIRIDISKQYGTSSLLIGAQLANPKKGSWFNVIEDVFNMTLEDWTLTSIIDTFRYSDGVFDAVSEMPLNVAAGFIPNLYKSVVRMINYKKVEYSKGLLGNLEYLAYSMIPGSYNWLSTSIDPYTGEEQVRYSNNWFVNILNEFLPTKLYTYKMSDAELVARSYGVNKTSLKGEYEDIDKVDKVMLNKKYGELNNKDLKDFINDKVLYEVEDKNGRKIKLKYSKMSNEQKESVLTRIMNKNAQYAKIYVWTQSGHKYYCSSSKRAELLKVGITQNILIGNKGFVN